MNILVTGGAGYIGSILVEHLLRDWYRDQPRFAVTVLDNFMYGQTSLNHLCNNPMLTIVEGDCRDVKLIQDLLKTADIIIPLAAIVGAPACKRDPPLSHTTNIDAINDLMNLLSDQQRIIYPTTNSGYGIGEPGKLCDESTPLRPISAYGKHKVIAEQAVLERKNSISLRLATAGGMSPRMRLDLLLNDFVWRAYRDKALMVFEPHFCRNFVHVRDIAQCFIHAINNFDTMRSQIFNVGDTCANMSKWQLCERIQQHIPDFVFTEVDNKKDPDQRNYIVSNEKIERSGWKPAYTIDDTIDELLRGYNCMRQFQYGNV